MASKILAGKVAHYDGQVFTRDGSHVFELLVLGILFFIVREEDDELLVWPTVFFCSNVITTS
jgi:hypothetical protein